MSACLMALCAYAQTPVEKVIMKYEDVSGARNFIAQGLKMTLARKFMKNTPVALIAQDVSELAILKMEDVAQSSRLGFVADLDDALKAYKYYGRRDSKNGEVDIYLLYDGPETIEEMVIYNPVTYSLNSFYGRFTVNQLQQLDH